MSKPPLPTVTTGNGDLSVATTTAADEGLTPAQSISQGFRLTDPMTVTHVGFCVQGNYTAGAFTAGIELADDYGNAPPTFVTSGSNNTDRNNAPYEGDVVVIALGSPIDLLDTSNYVFTVVGNPNNGIYSATLLGMAPEANYGMSEISPEVLWGLGQTSGGFLDVDDKSLKFALFTDLDMDPDPIPEGSIPVSWQILGSPIAVNKFYGAGPPQTVVGANVGDFYEDVATQTYYVAYLP